MRGSGLEPVTSMEIGCHAPSPLFLQALKHTGLGCKTQQTTADHGCFMVCLLGRAQALFGNWNQLVTRRHERGSGLEPVTSMEVGCHAPSPLFLQALKCIGLRCFLFGVCRGSSFAVQAVGH